MAEKYWISFRLKSDDTYDDRYADLEDAIDDVSSVKWDDTSSFFLIESDKPIDTIANKLKTAINLVKDRLLIRNLDRKAARYMGKFSRPKTLKEIMPYAERVS